ncbi:MAG TPA: alkaline phosphatase family protein, partial [Candidatus Tumulicola sp.]
MKFSVVAALVAAAFQLTACSGGSQSFSSGAQPPAPLVAGRDFTALKASGAGKIQHVVIIVQENRSFDNLFQGYPGADTVSKGKNSKGETITLQAVSLSKQYIIDHSATAMFAACRGRGPLPGTKCRMDGFDQEGSYGGPTNGEYA